jgi:hypothetical protein
MAKNLVDEFLEGVGNAVKDVREKAVEEAWFGRTVTDNIQPSPDVQAAEPAAATPGNGWPEYVRDAMKPDKRDDISAQEPGLDR